MAEIAFRIAKRIHWHEISPLLILAYLNFPLDFRKVRIGMFVICSAYLVKKRITRFKIFRSRL